ncbi:tRNA (34-2'-O)-methyltransferase regulator WDR6 [Brachionichthys hirsutus]|uniref:tRNA (34-2'-O)-methyltransferase regulator WDR6 n=1 Tax=Brachionichthys hirsutus TaxID=412623 RepID=UPI003604FE23
MKLMETAALVAPVTALEFLGDTFLLTGEGPVLTAYSLLPHPRARASHSVLQHYRIHGIRPRPPVADPAQSPAAGPCRLEKDELRSTSEPNSCVLAVFGGKALRLVRFCVDLQDGAHLHWEILGALAELQDWVLDVRWLLGDKHWVLCVAVAHNKVLLLDAITGNALVQRSCLEGCLLYSALLLVHTSWADTVLVGGTVFNQMVLWRPGGTGKSRDSGDKAPVERRLLGHTGVIFSVSYLRENGWLASASDDRSVRLWDVGDLGGPGGSCGDLNPTCLMVLYGHQARVFSVRLSPGKAFSAGEDGVCLVWDLVGSGKVVSKLKGHRAGGVRGLAVSEGRGVEGRWVATGGADGGVRLWRMEGSEDRKEGTATEKLSDLKFPGPGLPKVVRITRNDDGSWSQSRFVVCTDQGIVHQYSGGQWEAVWTGTPEFQSYCVMETITVSVKNSPTKAHLCAVGNLSGSIYVFPISQPECGILLSGGSGKIHSLIWQEAKEIVYLLASGAGGVVCRWVVKVNLNQNCSLSLNVSPLPPFLLRSCAKCWLTAAVCLGSTSLGLLWVCGDRRGSLLLFREDGKPDERNLGVQRVRRDIPLVHKKNDGKGLGCEKTGSGAMAERNREEASDLLLHPLSCLFGVHGKQGVSSVCEYQGLLYSCGRDGCVRIFKVCPTAPDEVEEDSRGNTGGLQLEVLRVQRACKGMEWVEGVLILEPHTPEDEGGGLGEDTDRGGKSSRDGLLEKLEVTEKVNEKRRFGRGEEEREREARFAIVGFHAVHFVVWDPVRQETLLAVPCGGGHRSWSLWLPHKGFWPGYGALVFIKQGDVWTSQLPGETPSWAGRAERTEGWGLREGIHGRGIGCVCRLGRIRGIAKESQTSSANVCENEGWEEAKDVEKEDGYWEIVVTGGEDTSLTILAIHPNSGSVKVLSVITDHISSIRTVAAVTRPEEGSDGQFFAALLVSAGGRAQMQCYRLLISWDRQRRVPACQVIQVANHRLDEQWERRRNRHKTVKMDPETRYMAAVTVDGNTDCVVLALACSDGALRLFSVSEVRRQIDLFWETFYHQRCVLSLAACTLEDGRGNRYALLFSAATDGKIAAWDLTDASLSSAGTSSKAPTPQIPCFNIAVHQSGVNSLAVWVEELGREESSCLVTVASGGDDGQLTVSTIRVQYPEGGSAGGSRELPLQTQFQSHNRLRLHLHSQSHVPQSHAAPLTALKVLSPGLLVSTSSDQRVCMWEVGSAGISHSGVLCSHVADASGLAVWEGKMIIGEEGDKKRRGRVECEQEIATWKGKESQTGFKTTCGTSEGCTGGTNSKDKEAGGEPVNALSEAGDPVCPTRDARVGDAAAEPNKQVWKTETEANSGSRSWERMERMEQVGWVLVCGQGLQLLRVKEEQDSEAARRQRAEPQRWREVKRRGSKR